MSFTSRIFLSIVLPLLKNFDFTLELCGGVGSICFQKLIKHTLSIWQGVIIGLFMEAYGRRAGGWRLSVYIISMTGITPCLIDTE